MSKSCIDLIFINTFACRYCKWSLLSLLENIKWCNTIVATTSLGLDLLENWNWESLLLLLDFTLHIHEKWLQSILSNGRQYGTDLGALCCWAVDDEACCASTGPEEWDNHLLSTHHTPLLGGQDPGYAISCTRSTPRGVLRGSDSFLLPLS